MGATYRTPPSTARVADAAQQEAEAHLFERIRALAPVIREHAATAEQERRLPKPVHQALIAGGFQRMLAPRSLGGFELDPVSCASVVEEIAGIDSATAWALQAPNVNVWWASKLSDQGAEEFYGSDPSRMMAAAFHPPQQAVEVAGGYRVTGRDGWSDLPRLAAGFSAHCLLSLCHPERSSAVIPSPQARSPHPPDRKLAFGRDLPAQRGASMPAAVLSLVERWRLDA